MPVREGFANNSQFQAEITCLNTCVLIVKHLLHVCFLFATGTESRDVFLLEARAALEKTLGGELLAAVGAQNLVTLPTHLPPLFANYFTTHCIAVS